MRSCTLALHIVHTGFRNPFRVKITADDQVYVSDTGSGEEIGKFASAESCR